jgi:hypothetical protein
MTEPLATLLDRYYYDTLLQIAAFNDLPSLDPTGRKPRKDTLITMLSERVYVPDAARASLAQLSALQRAVLDRILLHGGQVETHLLRAELDAEGLTQPCRTDGWTAYQPVPQSNDRRGSFFEDVMAELTRRGLVLSEGCPQGWNPSALLDLNPGLRVIVPECVRGGLPEPAMPSLEWGSTKLPAAPAEMTVALAQRDLYIYWSYVRSQPIALTQLGLVQKRTLRALNEQLLFPDPALATATSEQQAPRLHFLRLLLQGLGLLQRQDKRIVAEQSDQELQFWGKTLEERADACLRVWMHLAHWSELSSLGMSSFYLDLQRARGMLLEQLRLLEPNVWLSADRFLSRLSMAAPHLLFQSWDAHAAAPYHYGGGYLSQESRTGSRVSATAPGALGGVDGDGTHPSGVLNPGADRENLPVAGTRLAGQAAAGHQSAGSQWLAEMKGAFVGGALSGPLHWMGIVDIAADGSRLLAFRLNSSGALALGIRGSGSPAALNDARLIVQPNFQVFALGPVPEATLARIELFADRVKADRSALEYTLSHAAIYRGQKAGLSIDEIIAFLQRASGAALPQNVLRTLQEWGEQHERIVFHRAVALCEAGSPEMMTALCDDPASQSHLQKRLTPTVALLKKGRVQALRETLLQGGSLPAVSTQMDHCAGRLQATPDGVLAPVHEGPDFLLGSCLRRLAEEVNGRFHVTEGAVRRAMATGLGVKEYLDQLEELHHGPVPAALQMRIKAWGRYYGKASLQEAVLLEVKDSTTADELMEDAELAPLLSRFRADPRGRLLLVHAHDLERLHHLLEERGVEVTQQP